MRSHQYHCSHLFFLVHVRRCGTYVCVQSPVSHVEKNQSIHTTNVGRGNEQTNQFVRNGCMLVRRFVRSFAIHFRSSPVPQHSLPFASTSSTKYSTLATRLCNKLSGSQTLARIRLFGQKASCLCTAHAHTLRPSIFRSFARTVFFYSVHIKRMPHSRAPFHYVYELLLSLYTNTNIRSNGHTELFIAHFRIHVYAFA